MLWGQTARLTGHPRSRERARIVYLPRHQGIQVGPPSLEKWRRYRELNPDYRFRKPVPSPLDDSAMEAPMGIEPTSEDVRSVFALP